MSYLLVSNYKLDYILKQTLRKIKEEINGYPTVLWTGCGYHIYQPIKIVKKDQEEQPLEGIKEIQGFIPYVRNDLTTEFIRFAAKYLNGKEDPKHNASINSYLIRVPETVNSKYNQSVRIIQKWDGTEAIANPPSIILFRSSNTDQEWIRGIKKKRFDYWPQRK